MEVNALLLVAAILSIFVGHIIRSLRWVLLLPDHTVNRGSHLFVALSLSYIFNLILPFRLGEWVRIFYAHKRDNIRLAPVAASVIAERLTDLIVTLLLFISCLFAPWANRSFVLQYISIIGTASLALLVSALTIKKSHYCRILAYKCVCLFNNKIKYALLEVLWSFSSITFSGIFVRPKYVLLTLAMWGMYLSAYCFLILSIPELTIYKTIEILAEGSAFLSSPHLFDPVSSSTAVIFLIFLAVPLFIGLTYGFFTDSRGFLRVFRQILPRRISLGGISYTAATSSFKNSADYELFLESLFNRRDAVVSNFTLNAIGDGLVIRLFHGGSGALTALVQVNENLLVRKFAIGDAARKLIAQHQWIGKNYNKLPLVNIINSHSPGNGNYYFYDMDYSATARDFYEAIHTEPLQYSLQILDAVSSSMSSFHAATHYGTADKSAVDAYLHTKCSVNIDLIFNHVATPIDGNILFINGTEHDLRNWSFLKDMSLMHKLITLRGIAEIHGDLTVENIIVDSNLARGWYIIDPNSANIFNSPLLDWAKLYQSLHKNYELLNRGTPCHLHENTLRYLAPRSVPYESLYQALRRKALAQWGTDGEREIRLHEIIHYLRLTPYKFRFDYSNGLLFFAVCCQLIDEYRQDYGETICTTV